MEVIYRRRGEMVEICQELEYLTRILNEYEWFCRREEIKRDRMFDAVVSAGNARIKLISGDCNRIFFRFSIDDSKHFRGKRYALTINGTLSISQWKFADEIENGKLFNMIGGETCVHLSHLDTLTSEELLQGIRLLEIESVQNG